MYSAEILSNNSLQKENSHLNILEMLWLTFKLQTKASPGSLQGSKTEDQRSKTCRQQLLMPRVMRVSWHSAARPLRMTRKLLVGHRVEGHRNSFGLKLLYDTRLCVPVPDYNDIEVKICENTIQEHWAAQKYRVDEMLPAGMPGPGRAKLFQALVAIKGLASYFENVYNEKNAIIIELPSEREVLGKKAAKVYQVKRLVSELKLASTRDTVTVVFESDLEEHKEALKDILRSLKELGCPKNIGNRTRKDREPVKTSVKPLTQLRNQVQQVKICHEQETCKLVLCYN